MMDKQQSAVREAQAPSTAAGQDIHRAQGTGAERIFVPDVDIREDSDGIVLEANMPGVDQESVEVSIENGVLTIEGRARIEEPQGYKLVGQEYGAGRFRRDFTLSDAVDGEGIKARVCQGVLEITIPKHERIKTRRIKIET